MTNVTSKYQADSNKTTLTIRVESAEEFIDRTLEAVEALERGEDVEEHHVVSLPSEQRLNTVVSNKNIQLIRAVAREEPSSIRELSRILDRDVHAVSDAVNELSTLGILEIDEEGQSKKPRFEYDDIEIRVPVQT